MLLLLTVARQPVICTRFPIKHAEKKSACTETNYLQELATNVAWMTNKRGKSFSQYGENFTGFVLIEMPVLVEVEVPERLILRRLKWHGFPVKLKRCG